MNLPLPEDLYSEVSILATLCGPGNEATARETLAGLSEDDFMVPAHKCLLRALRRAIRDGWEISLITLRDALSQAGDLEKVGGFNGLAEILSAEEVGRPEVLANILRRKRRQRELIRLSAQLARGASSEMDPEALIAEASQSLHKIALDGERNESRSWLRMLEQVADGVSFGERHKNVFTFGIPAIDREIVAPKGGVTLLGARPGIGKTALLTQIAVESARAGQSVLVVNLELPMHGQEARLAANMTGIGSMEFRSGSYNNFSFPRHGQRNESVCDRMASMGDILGRGWTITPNPGTPWAKLEAEIRRHVDRFGVTAVVIDYFSLIGRSMGKGSTEAYAYAAVSEGITGLAKELQIGVLLLGQLKSEADGIKPTLASFADSDRPARDAWASLMLWRDKDQNILGWIGKNRDGRVGRTFGLSLDGPTNRWEEQERETSPTPKSTGRMG